MESRHLQHWPKQVPRHLTVPETSLYANLEISAQRFPEKTATVFYDARLTYRDLKQQVELLAGFLQNRCGVRKGDRVILQMQNSPQFIIAYYAILRADAVVLPVSPMHVTDELVHYFDDSAGVDDHCFAGPVRASAPAARRAGQARHRGDVLGLPGRIHAPGHP